MNMRLAAALALLIASSTVALPAAVAQAPERAAAPEQIQDGWRTASPAEVGMDPARLKELTRSLRAGEHDNVHALLIEKDGRLVYEEYFTGEDETWGSSLGTVTFGRASLHDVRSVSKSVVSTLVGIAIGGREIPSVDARLRNLLPEYAAFLDGEKAEIRLRHVLSMSAGLEWDEWSQPYSHPQNDWQQLTRAADPVAFVLDRDLVREPGSTFTYGGGLTHLLAVILERATGEQFDDYARRVLFEPLGTARSTCKSCRETDSSGSWSCRSSRWPSPCSRATTTTRALRSGGCPTGSSWSTSSTHSYPKWGRATS